MKIVPIEVPKDIEVVKKVAEKSFSTTQDSSLDEWFSFSEMEKLIKEHRGVCLKAISDGGDIVGMLFAQQESPINGKESLEKWVIVIASVIPEVLGKGVGSAMLTEIENQASKRNVHKMFVYTNKDDEKTINFYRKNGYVDAGWIRDYQYGRGNSAAFLLKYLK